MVSELNFISPQIQNGIFAILIALLAWVGLNFSQNRLENDNHPLGKVFRFLRNYLLATALLVYFSLFVFGFSEDSRLIKVLETILWIEVIWIVLSLFSALFFAKQADNTWRARIPGLFIDLMRFALAVVGASLVIAGVWNRDLGGLFATLGIGSIVIGLALQDTLGNLMSGIALLFERPFSEGDWIKIDDVIGQVITINWRAVHVRPRSLDIVVVPNSVLAKQRIHNFSRPQPTHGVEVSVSFSYNDPPNAVKRVLLKTIEHTRGVSHEPAPVIRTLGYRDSSIEYQVRFFITDYARLPDIQEEFLTQVWYAARRSHLTFAFPTRTVLKTEVPAAEAKNAVDDSRELLKRVSLFSTLSSAELESLARDGITQSFAHGERVLHQGDPGDSLYIIKSGSVVISLEGEHSSERPIARLGPGEFFGELALLAGAERAASVTATEDLELLVIYKESLKGLLQARPSLVEELASLAESRRAGIAQIREDINREHAQTDETGQAGGEILGRIRRFFGL